MRGADRQIRCRKRRSQSQSGAIAIAGRNDGAGGKSRASYGRHSAVRSVKMSVRVGNVLRLLLSTTYTGDRIWITAESGKRRQLGSRRNGTLSLTEPGLIEVVLVRVDIGKSGDRRSVIVRMRRHRGHLVGEVTVLVVSTDLGLVLLHIGGVLSKHRRRTRPAIFVMRGHGTHSASRTGADPGFVLGPKLLYWW